MSEFIRRFKKILVCFLIFGMTVLVSGKSVRANFLSISIDGLLKNGISICGSTLYVWGGGWNEADDGSGETAVMEGAYPGWKEFFDANRTGYDYKIGQKAWQDGVRDIRFNGLDCSGFLGWNIFNSLQGEKDPEGYVTSSTKFASSLSSRGYGNATESFSAKELLPGDIISLNKSGHVYMVVGVCADDSVIVMHSTPGGGVQLSGLCHSGRDNIATKLAREFMSSNYPLWWESFGKEGTYKKDASAYLSGIRFSWSHQLINDPLGLRGFSGEEMMGFLKNASVPQKPDLNEEAERTIYRLLSPANGEHLYTTDKNEVRALLAAGWIQEPSLGVSQKSGAEIFRLYNKESGEHLYTADKNEAYVLSSSGTWSYDNAGDPVFWGNEAGNIKVFRLFNPKSPAVSSHHYTGDTNETTTLLSQGWQFDNGGLPAFTL